MYIFINIFSFNIKFHKNRYKIFLYKHPPTRTQPKCMQHTQIHKQTNTQTDKRTDC